MTIEQKQQFINWCTGEYFENFVSPFSQICRERKNTREKRALGIIMGIAAVFSVGITGLGASVVNAASIVSLRNDLSRLIIKNEQYQSAFNKIQEELKTIQDRVNQNTERIDQVENTILNTIYTSTTFQSNSNTVND